MDYKFLKQADLFERISQRIPKTADKPPHPPFTLILGSGFSHGIIPTTAEVIRKDLPWWKWCQRADENGPTPKDFQDRKEKDPAFIGNVKAEAKAFWERVLVCHNRQPIDKKKPIVLDADGVPDKDSIGEAYRFALSSHCVSGLCEPDDVRRYFGDMIRRAGRRLNPAHLFLAAIIAEKPRLFGTIFTTNFDPLLQRSLQLVNAPYFVSDRPETLQYPDDDDVADAVHVIHAHGSIYRYLLVNSPEEIERYAKENQGKLQEYFRKHAVLIVGFSGWDDAITRALTGVGTFARALYWCDRNPDPDKSNLTPDAREILKRHANAFYVPIKDADDLMVQLHQHLIGHTLPRLFREPILAARDQLDLCDLTGVKLSRSAEPSPVDGKSVGSASVNEDFDLGNEVQTVRKRLDDAQDLFTGKTSTDPAAMLAAQVRQRFAVASDLYFSDKYTEALPHFDFVINANVLDPAERALAQYRRGVAYGMRGQAGDVEHEIADYTAAIDVPDAPAEQRAWARYNRGIAYGLRGQAGDVERALADCTAVIDMPDANAEQRARARVNRCIAYGKRGLAGDLELAIADCTAVIDMPDAPTEQRARACVNRGFTFGQRGHAGDVERAIADYTAIIDMPDANAEQRALARNNRGFAYGERGQAGDLECALADYTALIDMPDANAEQRADARVNRGITFDQRGQAGDLELAIADYTAAIDMPDAPAEQRADACVNRGVAYGKRGLTGDVELAIADYDAAIDMPDAPAELREKARISRDLLLKPKELPPKKKRK